MNDWIPLVIFLTIFSISLILRYLALKNLSEEYANKRLNYILSTKEKWSLDKKMYNEKGKRYYIASKYMAFLWVTYLIIIILYNSPINK